MQPDDVSVEEVIQVIDITELKHALHKLIEIIPGFAGKKPKNVSVDALIKQFNLIIPKKLKSYIAPILKSCAAAVNTARYQRGITNNEGFLNELAAELDQWWTDVAIGLIDLPTQNYAVDSYFQSLEKFMFLQAVYDLISGKLHRLDPVIGEMGCQWRVPFVLDAQESLLGEIVNICDEDEDSETLIAMAVAEYEAAIELLDDDPRLHNLLDMTIVGFAYNDRGTNAKQKTQMSAENHSALRGFFKHIKQHAPVFVRIHRFAKIHFASWARRAFTTCTARDYLTVCRLIAARTKRKIDCFGLSAGSDQCLPPATTAQVKGWISLLAQCSMEYMNHVALQVCANAGIVVTELGDNRFSYLDEDGTDCRNTLVASIHCALQHAYSTNQLGASFDTHVFFGPLRLIFMYQYTKGQPIIIDHRRLKCTKTGNMLPDGVSEDAVYELVGAEILYFEPAKNGGFVYVANPSNKQMKKVGMCVETYSTVVEEDTTVYGEDDQPFLSTDWPAFSKALKDSSIINLILMAAADHPELPKNMVINGNRTSDDAIILAEGRRVYEECTPFPCTNPDAYMQTIIGPSVTLANCPTTEWSILAEKDAGLGLLERANVTITKHQYGLDNGERCRTICPMPFGAIHIYGCTYAVKVEEMNAVINNPDLIEVRNGGVRRILNSNEIIYRPY